MALATHPNDDRASVLVEALQNAGTQLGLKQSDLGRIVGKNRTAISRGQIDPASKAGELALLFVRCYRALYALTGGSIEQMRHWMKTENHHTGGVPAEQIKSIQGLVTVVRYLDAIRGKL
jgi:hypothetical protein